MKFSDIKFGLYSLVLGVTALLLYCYFSYSAYQFHGEMVFSDAGDQNAALIAGSGKYHLIFSIFGLVFGILGLINKKKFSIPGSIISFTMIILSFFPIWLLFI